MSDFTYDKDADGIVTLTMDMQGQSANTMNSRFVPGINVMLDRLEKEDGLTGVVIASAKDTFFAGGDLKEMLTITEAGEETFSFIEANKAPLRRLEKLPVPVVAAINGAALGGGYEICLASNHRIIVSDKKAVVGLPEVTLGLLPGAGGVVRMTALIGLEAALPLLLEGKQLKPEKALATGLVDAAVATTEELVPAAKAWIRANPDAAAQPWDRKGFRYPGGAIVSPKIRQIVQVAPAMLFEKTRGLMPAPEKILDVAVNSMRMSFDAALRMESRGMTALIATPEAKAAITSFFFGMQAIKSGKVRPKGERWAAKSSAVLGAGMMGAGISYAHALRGLPTMLKDMDMAKAEKGKAWSDAVASKGLKRGWMTEEKKAALLDRITPVTDDAAYKGTDIIIEAVFEDISLKEKVIPQSFEMLAEDGVYGSNTSTLPISILAESCPDPSRFIGIHFFSPVDKMKVVEIIVGEKTSEETLRKTYDYVQQIGYMPIVVNDARGFFTSRVFGTFMDEGQSLIVDGMKPVSIERAAWAIGMPVGPLAVQDEVSMVLGAKVFATHEALDERLGLTESGYPADSVAARAVGGKMVEMGRGGRYYGGGFYDYREDGSKQLWDGLSQFAKGNSVVSYEDAKDRLLYRQAVETLRCFHEGVLRTETEANLGGIFAIGFPAWTGGALQFIRGVGIDAFGARANALAEQYGDRFRVSDEMLETLRSRDPMAV